MSRDEAKVAVHAAVHDCALQSPVHDKYSHGGHGRMQEVVRTEDLAPVQGLVRTLPPSRG